jgi:hypothetical protein
LAFFPVLVVDGVRPAPARNLFTQKQIVHLINHAACSFPKVVELAAI